MDRRARLHLMAAVWGLSLPAACNKGGLTSVRCSTTSAQGCVDAGQLICDPSGNNQVGVCTLDVNGCLEIAQFAACAGAHETCAVGAAGCSCEPPPLSCAAPGSFCALGDAGVTTCAVDDAGCLYLAGTVACPANEGCDGGFPSAACACDSTCAPSCSADGTQVVGCALDANGCAIAGPAAACPTPEACSDDAGAVCVCPAVGPGVHQGCTAAGDVSCDPVGGGFDVCTATGDAGCLLWTFQGCPSGLVCGQPFGSASCICAASDAGATYVDAVNGSDSTGSGAQEPPECRFGTLGKGLAWAKGLVEAADGGSAGWTVYATGADGGPMVFTGRTDGGNSETFPLAVSNGVTLTTTDPSQNPQSYVIACDLMDSGVTVVTLGSAAELSGFTIEETSLFPVTDAGTDIGVYCTQGTVFAHNLLILGQTMDGGPQFGDGVAAVNNCQGTWTNITVKSARGTGFAFPSDEQQTVSDVQATGCGVGMSIGAGKGAAIVDAGLTGNVGGGLWIAANPGGSPYVTVTHSVLSANGVLDGGAGPTANHGLYASEGFLVLNGVTLEGNGAWGLAVAEGQQSVVIDGGLFEGNGVNTPGTGGGIYFATASTLLTGQLDGVTSVSNVGQGLRIIGGGPAVGTAIVLSQNTGDGLVIAGGDLTLHGAIIDDNGGAAVDLNTGSLRLDEDGGVVQLDGNGDGGAILSNVIDATYGNLTMVGTSASPIDIGQGPASGISLIDNATALSDVWIHDNQRNGIQIVANVGDAGVAIASSTIAHNEVNGVYIYPYSAPADGGGFPVTFFDVQIEQNRMDGIYVDAPRGTPSLQVIDSGIADNLVDGIGIVSAAPVDAGPAVSLVADQIAANGNDGINAVGGDGVWSLLIEGCTIQQNQNLGVNLEQHSPDAGISHEQLLNNQITQNGMSAVSGISGVWFQTTSILDDFEGNAICGNGGYQVQFSAPQANDQPWDLDFGSCQPPVFPIANPSATGFANEICCYSSPGTGLYLAGDAGLSVNAAHVIWQSRTPDAGDDYLAPFGAQIAVAPACSAATGTAAACNGDGGF